VKKEREEVESMNENLGGEKRKKNENENQNVSNGGNSNRAVFGVFSGYTCDCR
jgi:hypothetical protein